MVAIQIKHLSKRFGDNTVLDRIDLQIQAGEMFFLLGPSGCGKTTLLRHIAGFNLPDEGSVWFGEQEVTRVPPYLRGTAMMFQSYALWPHLTVAENVAFGLEERRLPRTDISGRVAEALNVVQLGGLGERRIQQLSGGQQQRVALARALVVRPHCLLLDEPLSNLDAQLRLEMRSEIRRVCKEYDLTAVYVTHDQEEALSMADRLAVMVGGRLAQVGTPQAVYRNPVSRMVAGFIGETNLFRGQVLGPANRKDTVVVQTESGPMTARITIPDWRPGAGEAIWLSVRPEAIQLESSSAPNSFAGELIEAVYLGASTQYRLRLASGQMLCIAESNPAGMVRSVGQTAVASTSSDDLIVLPG
jgi:ABC-type Fe3+/spermidine/putrescine transport system ATPase subunit